jgi:FAD/FMN-containing dehydrogenase
VATVHPWYVLLQLSSSMQEGSRDQMEAVLEAGMEKGLIIDATISDSIEQTRAFWKIREFLPDAQKPEGGSIKHDVSVPVAKVPEFLRRADAAVEKLIPGTRPVPFGHMGDGNIHYNVSQPVGADKNGFLMRWYDVNDVVHQVVADLNGSISAEHGIGVIKRDLLPAIKDPVAFELMKTLKQTLDPNGILNPGKVV